MSTRWRPSQSWEDVDWKVEALNREAQKREERLRKVENRLIRWAAIGATALVGGQVIWELML